MRKIMKKRNIKTGKNGQIEEEKKCQKLLEKLNKVFKGGKR